MHAIVHAPLWAQGLFQISVGFIVFLYLVIAWQFWDARNNERVGTGDGKRARGALGELIAIFVLCAFSGYAPKLIFGVIPEYVSSLWPMMLVSHCLLALWAGKFVLGRQAAHIMARLG